MESRDGREKAPGAREEERREEAPDGAKEALARCRRADDQPDREPDHWTPIGHPSAARPCGFFGFAPGTDFPRGRGGRAFRGLTFAMFAKRLMPIVRRTVTDQTGLTGHFDAVFDF